MQRIRRIASVWSPVPGRRLAAFDALVLRTVLLVSTWSLAHWFPGEADWIRSIALGVWALNIVLWLARRRQPAQSALILALVNQLSWSLLAARTGSGQSPFLLGCFLEIGLAGLRMSVPACGAATLVAAASLGFLAAIGPDPAAARAAVIAAATILVTGTAFAFMVRQMRRLDASERQRARAAYVAHGVKNSLHGVAGFAELLATDLPPDDPRGQLTQRIRAGLDEAAGRLQELMNPAAQPRDPNGADRTDLRAAVERALETCHGILERGNVQHAVEVPPGMPAHMTPEAIHTVLVDVIQNAVEAMQPQGGCVRFEAASDPMRLLVRDTGPGIPAALRERIFEPGFTTRAGGHGLGLSEASQLLRRHGGAIRAVASPGGGAQIEIRLRKAGSGSFANRVGA